MTIPVPEAASALLDAGALAQTGPSDPGPVVGWLRDHRWAAYLVVGLGAGLAVGVVLGALSVGVAALLRGVRVPMTIAASKLFGRPYGRVRTWQWLLAGWLGAVAVTAGAGLVLWLAALARPLFAAPGVGGTFSLFALGAVVAVVAVVAGSWWVVTHRWLPAYAHVVEPSVALARVHRDWTVLNVGYGVLLAVALPVVAFFLTLVIFWE